MNKRTFGTKLSRERSSRELLFVGLVENLVLHGRIKTTKAKAKAIVGLIDRLVVIAKKNTLASKRQILKSNMRRMDKRMLFGALIRLIAT